MSERASYTGTQDRWDHSSATDARDNEPGPTFRVPADPTDAQCDDGGEADTFKEESQAQHGDAGVLPLGRGCGVEDYHAS